MQNVRALERVLVEGGPKDAADRIARVESIDASGIRIDGESVTLDSLVVDTLTGWLERNTDGEFEAATWFQATEVEPAEIEVVESNTEEESPETTKIRIGDFRLEGTNSIVFRDQSVKPAVQLNMNDLSLAVADFDTGNTNQPMTVAASTKLGTYSLIKTEGTISPLAEKISADMEAHIEQLELPPLTPYSERYVGYRLKSGVFNGDFIVKIDQGELDTQNEFLVNALAMDRLTTDEKDEFAEQVGYPVNTALSLLRDKNGDIKLSIPVTGPMDDPDTDLGSVISKATFNAVKGSVLIVFKPLGAIFDRANTLKFVPVEFPVASAELPDDVRAKLNDVITLLDKKPGIRLTLCGVTTTADENFMIARKREELEAAALEAAANNPEPSAPAEPEKPRNPFAPKEPAAEEIQEAPAPAPEPEPITLADEELLALSQARGEAVKNFLVQEGGIDSERLVLCTPGLDEEEGALPRVDFSL